MILARLPPPPPPLLHAEQSLFPYTVIHSQNCTDVAIRAEVLREATLPGDSIIETVDNHPGALKDDVGLVVVLDWASQVRDLCDV